MADGLWTTAPKDSPFSKRSWDMDSHTHKSDCGFLTQTTSKKVN